MKKPAPPYRRPPQSGDTRWRPRLRRRNHPLGLLLPEPISSLLPTDPELTQQLAALAELERRHRQPGANIRHLTRVIAKHPVLVAQLDESEELEESMPCHRQLRARRRRGLLRHSASEGGQAGFSLFAPPPPLLPARFGRDLTFDVHLGCLADELELEFYVILRTDYGWRPVQRTLNSFEVRAVFGLTAAYFYEMNRNFRLPGRLLPYTKYDSDILSRWFFSTVTE